MNKPIRLAAFSSGMVVLSAMMAVSARADLSGTTILSPVIAPPGGYAANPQEYLSVAWSVSENSSDIYTYSYTITNPKGDEFMNGNGVPNGTPEIFAAFSLDFNTTAAGAYIANSQM